MIFLLFPCKSQYEELYLQYQQVESYMISFKEKTRDELIAGFRRAIERKKRFEEQAQREFADMRKRGAELKSAL